MRTVIIYIIGVLLAVLKSTDAATDASLALVVFAEVLRVRQHGLKELQRNNLHAGGARTVSQRCLVFHLIDAAHADVLYHLEVLQILLTERHPEARALNGGIIDYQRLYLLMVQQITVARTDVGIGQVLVNLQRFCLHPLSVLPVKAFLGNLADVDFRVEVGCECLVMVTSITVNDVKILYLVEVMLCCISGENACNARVEATTEDCGQSCLTEAVAISPLPRVLEVCLVFRLIVGCVEIVASARQASIHNGEVLIRQREVNNQLWLVIAEQCLQLLHIVSIYLRRAYRHVIAFLVNSLHQFVALLLAAACYHKLGEHVCVLHNLKSGDSGNTTCTNHQYSTHF